MTESESFHRYSGVDGFSISVRVGHTAAEFELHWFIGRDRLQNQCAARRILLDCARHFGAVFGSGLALVGCTWLLVNKSAAAHTTASESFSIISSFGSSFATTSAICGDGTDFRPALMAGALAQSM